MGGVALIRGNYLVPHHRVSWKFLSPSSYKSAAIFLPVANSEKIDIVAYNLEKDPVSTEMTVWNIKPGLWRVRQGMDTTEDQQSDSGITERLVYLENGEILNIGLKPRMYNIINMELVEAAETDYWERPDLGINPGDVKISGKKVSVRIYNLGAVKSPVAGLELKDAKGNMIAKAIVPPIEAPVDLIPKFIDLTFTFPEDTDLSNGSVQIDPEGKIIQITRRNDLARW